MSPKEIIAKLKEAIFSQGGEIVEAEIEEETVEANEVDNHGYVVVNLTQKSFLPDGNPAGGLLVMPIEHPSTHPTLNKAMGLVARMSKEFEDHVYGKTLRIYRLVDVSEGELLQLFEEMRAWRSK